MSDPQLKLTERDEGEHKEAVEACTQGTNFICLPWRLTITVWISALLDDPEYVKVLQRRASSHEMLGTWSSLSAARDGIVGSYRGKAND